MALACPVSEHPVGDGAFCRICGRTYVSVADPVRAQAPAPDVTAVPLTEPAFKHEALSADPVLDTALIQTRFAEMTAPEAPLGDLATLDDPSPEAAPEPDDAVPSKKTPRVVPPAFVHALAGAGGGALLMALVDRFVL